MHKAIPDLTKGMAVYFISQFCQSLSFSVRYGLACLVELYPVPIFSHLVSMVLAISGPLLPLMSVDNKV